MEAKALLLIKPEAAYNTDSEPAAANVIWAENVQYTPRGQFVAGDPAMPGLGGVQGHTVGEHGELTFDVPLSLSGTAGVAPKWGPLHNACGYSETIVADTSVTYALAANPAASTSVSIAWRKHRRLHRLTGAFGLVGYAFDEMQRPVAKYRFLGLKTNPADAAVLAQADATWTGWVDVKPVDQAQTVFTFNGVNPGLRSFSIEQSDNLVFSDRPGEKRIDIAGARTFTGRVRHTMMLPSELNPEALKTAGTLVTASIVHGVTAGKILTLTTKGQITGDPSYSDDKGKDVVEYGYDPKPSALGVDDQLTLVAT
ncbi:hypothetical protein [Phenylobacterium sp.]|uniref:hypothetical protein n=1 Tax=Phenylobacterium sp. TaxID=1871053 RepID=UPI00391D2124